MTSLDHPSAINTSVRYAADVYARQADATRAAELGRLVVRIKDLS
jgi:hypothetical protein